jgi:hydrogenase maturation protein HypF
VSTLRPGYRFISESEHHEGSQASVARAAELLAASGIVAVKGLGGYHLACDATNANSVAALRERKFRKEKPFALMARDLDAARAIVDVTPGAEALLLSIAHPIVLAPARPSISLPGVAPDSDALGVMLPYAPLHHLLFAAGAPRPLVMTSANRSSEPLISPAGRRGPSPNSLANMRPSSAVKSKTTPLTVR